MTKVLLVEDDNNLREIYEARLAAEGYEISTAKDGEDALAVAKQVKPDLIISDVMMPRISGFEMLDILRNTEGLKHTKIIMLTALGQSEDKTRADSLGADRYLVKSQVTLEDIVKAADELLNPDEGSQGEDAAPTEPVAATPEVSSQATGAFSPIASPDVAAVAHQTEDEAAQTVSPMPTLSSIEVTDNPEAAVTPMPDTTPQPAQPITPAPPVSAPTSPEPPVAVAPSPEPVAAQPQPAPDDSAAAAQDEDDTPLIQMPAQPESIDAAAAMTASAQSTSQENAAVTQQIENFVNTEVSATSPEPVAAQPQPAPVASESENTANNDEVIQAAINNLSSETQTPAVPATPSTTPDNIQPEPPAEEPPVTEPNVAQISGKKMLTPINDLNASNNELQTLLAQEQMKEDLEKGTTGAPVIGDVNTSPQTSPLPENQPQTPDQSAAPAPPPGGVFMPNENGNANENAL